LGPRAENFEDLSKIFNNVLADQSKARQGLYPEDPNFITKEMKRLDACNQSIDALSQDVQDLSAQLATHTVPFWSPRYNGLMVMETAMSTIIGCKKFLFRPSPTPKVPRFVRRVLT
jgi:hypothetical protein